MKTLRILGATLFLLFLFAQGSRAQCTYTSVSATIVDPNAVPYSFANISADLVPAPPGGPTCTGGVVFAGHIGPIQTNGIGAFTMILPANASITPSSTQWQFTVQETGVAPPFGTGPQAFPVTITISGSSQNITSTLNAAAPALTVPIGGSGTNLLPRTNTWTGASNTFVNAVNVQGTLAGAAITSTSIADSGVTVGGCVEVGAGGVFSTPGGATGCNQGIFGGVVNTGPLPLILNGNFESSTNLPPDGWESPSNATVTFETVAPYEGLQTLKLTSTNNVAGNDIFASNITTAQPGDIFYITGAAKGDGAVTANISIIFVDKNTTAIGSNCSASTASTSYVVVSQICTAPAGTVSVVLALDNTPFTTAGTGWYDAISMLKKTGPLFNAMDFAGTTIDAQAIPCLAAALAANGICDGRGLPVTANVAHEIDFGNTSNNPVTFLTPASFQWTSTITDGASCAFKVFSKVDILGISTMYSTNGTLKTQNGTNEGALLCTGTTTGNLGYVNISGIDFKSSAGGANPAINTLGAAVVFQNMFESHVMDMQVFDTLDSCGMIIGTNGSHVGGISGADRFEGLGIEISDGVGNGLCVNGTTGGFAQDQVQEINLYGATINHPGPGKHAIVVTDGVGSAQFATQTILNIFGARFEMSHTDGTSSGIFATNAKSLNLSGIECQYLVAGATAPCVEYTYPAGKQTEISATGFTINNCGNCASPTSPGIMVQNDVTGKQVLGDVNGYGGPGWMSAYFSGTLNADTLLADLVTATAANVTNAFTAGSISSTGLIKTTTSLETLTANAGSFTQYHTQDNSGTNAGQNTTYIDPIAVSGQTAQVNFFRNTSNGAAGTQIVGFIGDGSSTNNFTLAGTGNSAVATNNGTFTVGSPTPCTSPFVFCVGGSGGQIRGNASTGDFAINGNFTSGNSVGAHFNTFSPTNDQVGTITIAAATSASQAFSTAYGSAPKCSLTPLGDTTGNAWWVSSSTTAVTANLHASGSFSFIYHCKGAPN